MHESTPFYADEMRRFSDASLDEIDAPRLRQLLGAVLSIGSNLELPLLLNHIVEEAARLVEARFAALGVLNEQGTGLDEFITTGLKTDQIEAIGPLPKGHGILGLLISEPEAMRLPDLSKHPESFGFPPNHPPMKSFLGVPIRLRHQVFGNLYMTEKISADEFSDDDVEIVTALAGAAALAIENSRLQTQRRDSALTEDRARIARDLHDTVIQRLFATGLSLQASLRHIQPQSASDRVAAAISDLDDTITQIRTTIFELETTQQTTGLRAEILQLTHEAQRILGFEPNVNFTGPIDMTTTDEQRQVLLAVLREALSNVAKHASATSVTVTIGIANGHIGISVIDNGVGLDPDRTGDGNGLRNLRHRAEELGGTMTISPTEGGGTTIRWRVPVN